MPVYPLLRYGYRIEILLSTESSVYIIVGTLF